MRGDPFPLIYPCSLRYGQAFTLTAGAAGVFGTEQVFRLNSLYDPDLTGTGHQPYGFDTLATLYFHYKVHAVTVSLRFSDPSADGIICGANFQNPGVTTTVTGVSPDVVMERPGMMIRDINNTGSQVVNFTQTFQMWQLCNVTKQQFDADTSQFESAYNTNPALTPYVRIAIAALDQSSTPTVRVQCDLAFHCHFKLRQILAQS
jgi:hypothetical protein